MRSHRLAGGGGSGCRRETVAEKKVMDKPGTPSTPGTCLDNHLAAQLRAASVGREQTRFAEMPDRRMISCGELFASAERIAAVLAASGIRRGDRVAVQVEKSPEVVQLYLGTVLAGGVFLPFNPAYTVAEMAYFLSDAQPSVFVCDPRKVEAMSAIAEEAGVSAQFSLAADGSGTLMDAAAEQFGGFAAVACGEDDLAAILYTSGTTGRSKGAMLSHGNLVANARTLTDYWCFSDSDVLIHALPMFHTHGLFVAIHVALMARSSLIFLAGFDADAIIASMSRATTLMGVPTFYVRLLEHAKLNRAATADMRLFVSGSAPLPTETHQRWREKTGHAILERYGLTETGMNLSNPYHGERRAGRVGLPLPGVEMRITDPGTGLELPHGEVGVIEVRGANVFRGYWRMPEKTREELRDDGFFITGDLAVVDDLGYVSIVGRAGDLIISGGYNIYPKEIENRIDEIEGVKESAVIGLPHPDFGECVVAVVVGDSEARLTEEDVLAHLKDKLAKFKQPKRIFFVEQLPRNAMGKIQKNSLREKYGDAV